jgi:hypothetical protein
MPDQARTFRVFVSSTFSDLKAERNALQEKVFPRLRKLAAEHGSRFQAIDLRWGVSDQASLDQQAMNICLGEIERCQQISPRPNFIVLLGDRYGWLPPPSQIPEEEFNKIKERIQSQEDVDFLKDWYELDKNAVPPEYRLKARQRGSKFESYENWQPVEAHLQGILARTVVSIIDPELDTTPYTASATEQEIAAGALQVEEASEHVFCFLRGIEGLPQDFNAQAFQDEVRKRLQAAYGDQSPEPAVVGLISQIFKQDPGSTAGDFDQLLKTLGDQVPGSSLESDFLSQVRGWLAEFTAKDFQNLNEEDWSPDQASLSSQKKLKARLESHVPANTYHYQAQWNGRGITTTHIDQLCEDVYTSLSKIILQEIEGEAEIKEEWDAIHLIDAHEDMDDEGLAHRDFAEERLRFFIGRTEIRQKIAHYLNSVEPLIFGISGEGGTGKSALTAMAIVEAHASHPGAHVVYRFIGATPGSSDGRSLLDSLCREITRRYGADESDIPLDYRELVPEFGKRLGLATASEPLIIFIDSLDQLQTPQGVRDLTWLPDKLPENVSLIVTTRPEDTYDRLQAKQAIMEQLGGLSRQEGQQLLKDWLEERGRKLQEPQQEAVLDAFTHPDSGAAPLYLKLAFEEAQLWVSGNGQPPEVLATGIKGIIRQNMINRLADEGNHGDMLVSHVLGYLAASRYGLAEDEVIDLLSRDREVYRWFLEGSYHVPADLVKCALEYQEAREFQGSIDGKASASDQERAVAGWLKEIRNPPEELDDFLKEVLVKTNGPRLPVVLWSRLSFDLEPYLSQRNSEGSTLLAFYHRELGDVSREVFLENGKEIPFHEKLAAYFRFRSDPGGEREWDGSYPRGLSELPYHLTLAKDWDQVYETLTDFRFLEEKAAQVGVVESKNDEGQVVKTYTGVFQLQEDYERALGAMPGEGGAGAGAGEHPLIITAVDRGEGLTVYCPVCNKTSPIEEDQLDMVIYCPTEGCGRGLKINPFYTDMAKGV